jgi:murein DD-endopeptidase MepM/ murein hydrolase activator NlpD
VADPWSPEDGVYAAARYLAAAGGRADISRAVFAYNHAQWYVDEVLALARLFGGEADAGFAGELTSRVGSPEIFFQVEDLARRLSDARRRVVRAQGAIGELERRIERLGWRKTALEQQAGDPSLSDAAFRRLEQRVTRVAVLQDRLQRSVETRRDALDYAVSALDELKKEQASASVAPAADQVFGGAESAPRSEYVFPVGGGPSVVSVAHTHHDYPAADIAAPEGSPVYALNDGTILHAYRDPNGRCGIGFMIRLAAGPTLVYCHLAYMEPDVVPGAAVAAGAQVGLVGHTGHATGPHLHLQFSPPTTYPQNETWFRSFAGKAFAWQDAPTPKPEKADGPAVSFSTGDGSAVGFTP